MGGNLCLSSQFARLKFQILLETYFYEKTIMVITHGHKQRVTQGTVVWKV
jgi:hypothetical protein